MHLEHRATLGASLTGTFPALHKAFAKYSPAGDESQLNEESGVIIAKKSHWHSLHGSVLYAYCVTANFESLLAPKECL